MIGTGRKLERMKVSVLLSLIMVLPLFSISASPIRLTEGLPHVGRGVEYNITSLSGIVDIADAATSSFWGPQAPPPGSRFGDHVWIGDLNGDGFDDVGIAAPYMTGYYNFSTEGQVYFWYGSADWGPSVHDVMEQDPDLIIEGHTTWWWDPHEFEPDEILPSAKDFLGRWIDSGDLDDDGYLDIVVGSETPFDAGRIDIIWGREEGFPKVIHFIGPDCYPNITQIPNSFLNRGLLFEEDGKYYHLTEKEQLDVKFGYRFLVRDLDGDGIDDLILSVPISGYVNILWGGGVREKEYRMEPPYHGYDQWDTDTSSISHVAEEAFGQSLDVGDIDGDSYLDLVVGAPQSDDQDRGRQDVGAAFLFFNLTTLRNRSIGASEANAVINGTNTKDLLGSQVLLYDVNHDGKEDIFIGAPGADGITEDMENCGEILLCFGDASNTFPATANGENIADRLIMGNEGEDPTPPRNYGDKLGSNFNVGDLNGDGYDELVIGIYMKNPIDDSDPNRVECGAVLIYDLDYYLQSSNKVHIITYPANAFSIQGNDQEDAFGYSIAIGDVNGDGAKDLLFGVPHGDCENNGRKSAGEAYLMIGSKLTVGELDISGAGASGDTVFAGGGEFNVRAHFHHAVDAAIVEKARIRIDPGGENLLVEVNGTDIQLRNDRYSTVGIDSASVGFDSNGMDGLLSFNLSFDWYVPMNGPVDIEVSLFNGHRYWMQRMFRSRITVLKDIGLTGKTLLSVDGREMLSNMEWLRPGQTLVVSGPDIHYRGFPGRHVGEGVADIVMYMDGIEMDRTHWTGANWTLGDLVPKRRSMVLGISPDLVIGDPPEGLPPQFIPRSGDPILISMRSDLDPPSSPGGINVYNFSHSQGPGQKRYSMDIDWAGGMGPSMDSGESGVKEYMIKINDDGPSTAISPGGLYGTYYVDDRFEVVGLERVDPTISFEWGVWGPDPRKIPPFDYSARWHGYLRPNRTGEHRFSVEGTGSVMIGLGGEMLYDWTELDRFGSYTRIDLTEGEPVPIVIYYKQAGNVSTLKLRWTDDTGVLVPIPAGMLYHAVNRTSVTSSVNPVKLEIWSVDWVGRSSDHRSLVFGIDDALPVFDTTGVSRWVNGTMPTFQLRVTDPPFSGLNGSGIDQGSLSYRTRADEDTTYSDWFNTGFEVADALSDGNHTIGFYSKVALSTGWSGVVQWRADDLAGNRGTSGEVQVEVDQVPPEIELLEPDRKIPALSGPVRLTAKVSDIGGSGVEGDRCRYRFRYGEGVWSGWSNMNHNGSQEEMEVTALAFLSSGWVGVQFMAYDMVSNSRTSPEFRFRVEDEVVNGPPIPVISSPVEGQNLTEGWPVTLDGSASSDDGEGPFEGLHFTWYSGRDGFMGEGKLKTVYLSTGAHEITLRVDDGEYNISTSVNITVKPLRQDGGGGSSDDDDKAGAVAVYVIVAVVIACALIVALLVLTRRKAMDMEEGQLALRELTGDDIEERSREIDEE